MTMHRGASCGRRSSGSRADKHIRLNLFYPDRIEKYVSKRESEGYLPDAKDFLAARRSQVPSPKPQVLGSTLRRGTWDLGLLRIRTALCLFFILQTTQISAVRAVGVGGGDAGAGWVEQIGARYVGGDGIFGVPAALGGGDRDRDRRGGKAVAPFKAGVEHLWISENPNARFGDFDTAELEQFLKVKDSFRVDIASVTGTPLHYFLQTRAISRAANRSRKPRRVSSLKSATGRNPLARCGPTRWPLR